MAQIPIHPCEDSGSAFLIASLQLEAEIVLFDLPPFVAVVEFQLVEGSIPVEARENWAELPEAAYVIRLLLDLREIELVFFLLLFRPTKGGARQNEDQEYNRIARSVHRNPFHKPHSCVTL